MTELKNYEQDTIQEVCKLIKYIQSNKLNLGQCKNVIDTIKYTLPSINNKKQPRFAYKNMAILYHKLTNKNYKQKSLVLTMEYLITDIRYVLYSKEKFTLMEYYIICKYIKTLPLQSTIKHTKNITYIDDKKIKHINTVAYLDKTTQDIIKSLLQKNIDCYRAYLIIKKLRELRIKRRNIKSLTYDIKNSSYCVRTIKAKNFLNENNIDFGKCKIFCPKKLNIDTEHIKYSYIDWLHIVEFSEKLNLKTSYIILNELLKSYKDENMLSTSADKEQRYIDNLFK